MNVQFLKRLVYLFKEATETNFYLHKHLSRKISMVECKMAIFFLFVYVYATQWRVTDPIVCDLIYF